MQTARLPGRSSQLFNSGSVQRGVQRCTVNSTIIGVQRRFDAARLHKHIRHALHEALSAAAQPLLGQLILGRGEVEGGYCGLSIAQVHTGILGNHRQHLVLVIARVPHCVGICSHFQEFAQQLAILSDKPCRCAGYIEHQNTQFFLLGTGQQHVAMLQHPPQRAAPAADHVQVALCKSCRAVRGRHIHDLHRTDINTEMRHLRQEVIMRSGADRHTHFLARQLACAGFVNLQRLGDNTVVIVGIADSHIHNLDVLSGGRCHHKRRHALAHGNLHITRRHRRRHCGASVERHPVDLDAHFLLIGAVGLGKLERHWPFQEIGHSDLIQMSGIHSRDGSGGGADS
mmetsp:Transcript_17133/g.22200  ORF Transcript_17133/g.22200 Transcript_17133/m.22200 type:complete len:342 (+) Transcript_17133:419-1444(+)